MDIISAKYLISSATYKQCPKADKPEYAFIGRSNVGKSSLINMLTGQTKLAKTSATPGKTQLINHFEVLSTDKKKWYLVDLPGYGYAKRAQTARNNWENMIESYIRKRENLVNIFVLVDSRHEPQPIDLEFVRKLGEWQVPFSIVFTKTDKNKPGATVRNIQLFLKELETEWEELPPNFATSAIEKEGRKELLKYISSINIDISTNYKKN
ncbi:MAG: hypothetical protein RL115_1602 [Bacteroidota bacterium]